MASDYAKEWSGNFKELDENRTRLKRLIRRHMLEHKQQDNHASDNKARQRKQQAIDALNQAHNKIDHFLTSNRPRLGQGKRKKEVKSHITDNESAKITTSKGTKKDYNGVATVDKKHQAIKG